MERPSPSLGPSDEGSTSLHVSSSSASLSTIAAATKSITIASRPRSWQSCRLESLPPELLEKIFFHSLEINLPRASWHIARVLSKPIIYKWLIRLAFSSANSSSRRDFFTPDFLPPPLDFWAVSNTERTHLQTDILECRWSTLELIRECQRDYVKQVIRQKCKDLIFSAEDQQALDNIDQCLSRPMDFDLAATGRRGSGDLVLKAKKRDSTEDDSTAPAASSTTAATSLAHSLSTTFSDLRVAFWIHFGGVQIREPSPVAHEMDIFRLPCPPSLDERPRMPDKLLRSPWTPEKLELLRLLSQIAYIDEDTNSSDRTHLVLRQLIRDRDFITFRELLSMNVVSKNYIYPQKWPVKTRHFRAALKYGDYAKDPFVMLLFNERWDVLGSRESELKTEILIHIDGEHLEERWPSE